VQTTASKTPGADFVTWKRQTALTALLLFAMTFVVSRIRVSFFPLYQVQSQDTLPLFVLSISLLLVTFWTPPWRFPEWQLKTRPLAISGVIVVGLLAFGSSSLMGNFPVSVDERMVFFDMAILDRGHLVMPLATNWRPYASTLVPEGLFNGNMPMGLASTYLPMNALLRLGFSKLSDPALFNPLLAFAGGAALLDIARRIFRDDHPACCVVLLIYALSAQMLVNAMTVYSMTGHMALNLVWLAAFLRGGRLGNSLAIVTGFIATGFHQLVFHPFFVAPFLLWRLRHREWKVVLLYGAAYSAIILWWSYYPVLVGHGVSGTPQATMDSSFAARISKAFVERRGDTIITMFLNVLRFAAWQNLTLLPLLSASVAVAIRDRGLPAVLLLGIAVWLVFISVVIPFQGHGWGYRYLHPYLGSFALLAGYGYRELRNSIGQKVDGIVLALSGATAVLTIPLLFIAAHRFLAPYAAVERLVSRQTTPMVLIDTYGHSVTTDGRWAGNAIENVNNLPDLSNRPLRFSSFNMTPELLAGLCRDGKISVITRADQRRVGFFLNVSGDSPLFAELVDGVQRKMPNCFVSAAGPSS
jgi:hypothetical protein